MKASAPPSVSLLLLFVKLMLWFVFLLVILKVVEVEEGAQSVTLPFRTRARLPGDATVEWTRSDAMKVHVYQSGPDHPEEQDSSYSGRTKMNEYPLQTGDLSLTLNDPTQADSSTYCCNICRDGDIIWRRRVQLQVKGQSCRYRSDSLSSLLSNAQRKQSK